MALLYTADTLPASSQDALERFDERYIAAVSAVQPGTWVSMLGESGETPALTTKYPMALLALKFQETRDQGGRFNVIGERDVELKVAEYDAGVEMELVKLLTNSFSARAWDRAPEDFVKAEQRFRLRMIAEALEANTALCGWDGLALFHDSHLCDPSDASSSTFDNLQASTKDVVSLANIEAEIQLMASGVLDINGDKLGVMPDTIGVPAQKFHALKNLLKQDFVPNSAGTATMRNPYNDGSLQVVQMDELTDANDWFLFDSKLIARGVVPWVQSALSLSDSRFSQLGLRYYGEDSDRFKNTGKIAVSMHAWHGFAFIFPHAIRRVAGA